MELLLALSAELLDLRAALTDDHTGLRAVDVNADFLAVAFDFDFRNTRAVKLLFQVAAEVVVLYQRIAEMLFIGKPAGIPILDDTYT